MKIIAIMAKSGVGKSTLIGKLIEEYPEIFHYVRSYTTREMRAEDPNDGNTHVFVDEDFWKANQEKAIAVYFSPKGYVSWVDESSFSQDKVNIYAIDPLAASTDLVDWAKDKLDIEVYGVYLKLDENERMSRWSKRHGSTGGFSLEKHLALDMLDESDLPYDVVELGEEYRSRGYENIRYRPMPIEEAYEVFKYAVEVMGGLLL